MIKRINLVLALILIATIVSYLYFLNPESISVSTGSNSKVTAPVAFILLVSFLAGFIFCAIFALFFGFKAWLKERRHLNEERKRISITNSQIEARQALACGEFEKAQQLWEKIINKDQNNVIARIELSKSYQKNAQLREALAILDKTRNLPGDVNIEVLFRAAEINQAIGNKTAAIDNLALIISKYPNSRALKLARDYSEEINRFEDAIEYHQQLQNLGGVKDREDSAQIIARLSFKKVVRDIQDPNQLKLTLKDFVRSKDSFVPALHKLAQLEKESGNTEEAIKLLLKASRLSAKWEYWYEASQIWLTQSNPERAIAAARAGNKELSGIARINSELELVKLYLNLNNFEEAKKSLDGFESLAREQNCLLTPSINQDLLILQGRLHNASGEYKAAEKIWQKLSTEQTLASHFTLRNEKLAEVPSPTLSTP